MKQFWRIHVASADYVVNLLRLGCDGKRIAAPMIGGLVSSFIPELLVYPAIYKLWKRREIAR